MKKLSVGLSRVVVAVVVLAVIGGGVYYFLFRDQHQKHVSATFDEAVGVYVGTPVKILGVQVGKVDKVTPRQDGVVVSMTYSDTYTLPATVKGIEVANSLVSDRYIELDPVYTGGKALPSGGSISRKNTVGPAELDDIYNSLNTLSTALGPNGANKGGTKNGALSTLLTVSAANLKGNGAALGNSITQLSKAARTLANGRGDLFATVGNLRKFTGALKTSDSQVRLFNTQLAQVAGDLANERSDLGAALHDLGIALNNVNTFVKANAGQLHTTITGLKNATGILVREKGALEETLTLAPIALANIVHSYNPTTGSLATRTNLSSLTNPVAFCSLLSVSVLKNTIVGQLTSVLQNACESILKNSTLDPSTITTLVNGLLGAVTGGLSSGGLPTLPIGGSSILPGISSITNALSGSSGSSGAGSSSSSGSGSTSSTSGTTSGTGSGTGTIGGTSSGTGGGSSILPNVLGSSTQNSSTQNSGGSSSSILPVLIGGS